MPEPRFSARAPWANPSFSALTQGRTAMPPRRIHRALHQPKGYVAASVSFHTLGLGFFLVVHEPTAVFGLFPRCALAVSVRKTGAPLPWVRNLVARRCVEWGEGRIRATRGWISVDRGSKATLPLTMPRRVFKSSAKDSAHRPLGRELRGGRPRHFGRTGLANGTGPWGRKRP